MLIEHGGRRPQIAATTYVAPDATLCGAVTIGDGARILHGARVVAEGGEISIGRNAIVMENAVVRSTVDHDCHIGDHVLIGPCAHVVGATLEEQVFIATGAAVFHGSRVEQGAEVRVGATVHLRSRLARGEAVPIGWIACGDPAQLFSPDQHEALYAVQGPLNFPRTAYGLARETPDLGKAIAETMSHRLASHAGDRVIDEDD